jgi:hypothetical protein
MLDKDMKRKLSLIYAIVLVFSALFIFFSLRIDTIEIKEKESRKEKEIKPVKVTLKINNSITYDARLENDDTVDDLLRYHRDEGNLSFEITAYAYGSEIEHINGKYPEKNMRWAVFHEGKDITYEISDILLENKTTYELKLIRNEEPQ